MVRLAQLSDLPFITHGLLNLKQQTAWSRYKQSGYNNDTLSQFIKDRLVDSQSVCYVSCCGDGQLCAFCGGSLNRFYLPPHMPLVFEWGWFGPSKQATECWHAVVQWGRKHGAELAGRVRAHPGSRPGKIVEQYVWKVLR